MSSDAEPRESVIDVTDIRKSFGPTEAVRGVDLRVSPGEMFSIVGPDGAGKTTTLRILCGILAPSSGSGTVLGHDLIRERPAIRPQIGYLSQGFSLYGDLSVDENIEFFARIHGVRDFRGRRQELLEFTRLTPFRGRLASRLSGGMKKKLALACTLVHRPRVIFLDEPTTGVDPVSRRDFWVILSQLLKDGVTVVLTTPYLDEAERCSRVGLLNAGSFMRVDTPARVRESLPGRLWEIVCSPARGAFKALRAQGMDPSVLQLYGDRVHVRLDAGEDPEERILSELREQGIGVQHWREVAPRLENVFISLLEEEGPE
jgi:ABC-2 type transport system ATP-binding protein